MSLYVHETGTPGAPSIAFCMAWRKRLDVKMQIAALPISTAECGFTRSWQEQL